MNMLHNMFCNLLYVLQRYPAIEIITVSLPLYKSLFLLIISPNYFINSEQIMFCFYQFFSIGTSFNFFTIQVFYFVGDWICVLDFIFNKNPFCPIYQKSFSYTLIFEPYHLL